uniref:peptidylprolyl isomerase n=1 Tax=Strigamia maritima TaxID=126957 RepID=T1J224_STRMM
MFSNDHEDDDFGATGGNSKLASLFDLNRGHDGNQSLMYNAPKQPKKSKPPTNDASQPSTTMSVVHAVAVHAYKFENGSHISQGKLGVAILGNNELKLYKLLLYKGQQQHVTIAMINVNFSFSVQANNYISFYDNQTVSWSINFDNEAAIVYFAKQLCIAKANSCGKALESLIFQDLVVGTGEAIDSEDSVEIKYSVNLITNYKLGELVDSNLSTENSLLVKINQRKQIKGLEDTLIGMKKGGQRLAIIPPGFGYGNKKTENSALKTCNLLYEIHIVKVKFEKDVGSRISPISVSEGEKEITRRLSLSSNDEGSVRARGASLSEQLSQSPDRKKATIISRIVKMGQPMIPLQGAIVAQPDSDNDEEIIPRNLSPSPSDCDASISSDASKPIPRPRPHHSTISPTQIVQQTIPQPMAVYQPQGNYPVPYQQISSSQFGIYGQVPSLPSQVVVSSENQMIAAENRGQIMEMRLQMSKMSDKLDTVLTKLDQPSQLSIQTIGSVDTASLSYNIQKLISENDRLKMELHEKTLKVETQNEKISDLLQKNHKFIEQSHEFLEQRASSLQTNSAQTNARITALEQEKAKYAVELQEAQQNLIATENNFKHSEQVRKELKEEIENMKTEMQKRDDQTGTMQSTIDALQTQRDELENMLETANAIKSEKERDLERFKEQLVEECSNTVKLESLKLKYDESVAKLNEQLSKVKGVETKSPQLPNIVSEVKRIMNGVYRKLQGEFEPDFEYAGRDVCNVIKDTVLTVTLKLVEKFEVASLTSAGETSESTPTLYIGGDSNESIIDTSEVQSGPQSNDRSSMEVYSESEKEDIDATLRFWKPDPPPPPYFTTEEEDEDDD